MLPSVTLGIRVRIKATEQTERLGFASRVGRVEGWSRPRATGVSAIGGPSDLAVYVIFSGLDAGWFAEDLIHTVH